MWTLKCCIVGCANKREDAFLHYFPVSDAVRLNKWLQSINSEELKNVPVDKLTRLSVCHVHFEKRFTRLNSRLRYGAYPSLFTPEEICNGVPTRHIDDIPNKYEQITRKKHSDHTYCRDEEPMPKVARFTDSVSTNSPMVYASTSTQAKSSVSTVKDSFPATMPILFVHDSTSSQAKYNSVSRSKDTIPATKSTPIVYGPTSSQEKDSVSRSKDTIPATKSTPIVYGPTSSQEKGPRLTVLKTPRASRKRLISTTNQLTPNCAKLYKMYNRSKKQADYLKRAKRALKFTKDNSFEELTKNMNPYAKKIMQMQISLHMKDKHAHRFTDTEKLIALAIMKQSPKCYRFLQKIFILPSKSTLNKLISQMNIQVGINNVLVDVMKKEVATWDNKKKFCSIIFDEMHLDERLNYNQNKDNINGFVHFDETQKEFADQAIVFMLRGAVSKWQQPLAFYFCKGATSPTDLKNILKKVVAASLDIGLKPIATICDQGSTFRRALGDLQQETRRTQLLEDLPTDDTVELCGKKLNVIYDPSHIIKGLRNNFLNKWIELDGHISKWQDIVDVYLTDCNHADTRLLYKLSDHHVIPEKMSNRNKMKVKTAARVLSSTVSAALSYTSKFSHYVDGRPVSETMGNTATTVKFFDNLFDSVNGAALHHKHIKGKELRKAVTTHTKHHEFWKTAIQTLEKIKFLDEKGNTVSVPTLKSCITTLKSLIKLWQFYQEQGLKVMRPRYFNSDPIENLFGQVRAYNFRYNDPDCYSFICTFRSLLITRMIKFHNEAFNCEDDQTDQLLSISQILKLKTSPVVVSVSCSASEEANHETETTTAPTFDQFESSLSDHHNINKAVDEARQQRLEVHSRTYTAGWVVRKVLDRTPCDECKKILTSETPLQIHKWVSHREFNQCNKRLSYPSETAVRCFGTAMETTNTFLEKSPHIDNISKLICTEVQKKITYEISCPKHRNNQFVLIVVKFAIHNWCNSINKILRGTDIVRLEKRLTGLPPIQKMAYLKYKSKLKNKSCKK